MRLLTRAQLRTEKGLPASKTYIWRITRHPDPDQRFPQPIKVSNQDRWIEEEVDAYIARLAAQRAPPQLRPAKADDDDRADGRAG